MRTSAINPNTRIMDEQEFKAFMRGKKVYHHQCGWIEKWKGSSPITRYFPYNGFVMEGKHKLNHYGHPGYGAKCLGHYTTNGKAIWTLNRWKVSIVEYGDKRNMTPAKFKKLTRKYYVTKMPVR